jgi:hypothetical protein
MAREAACTLNPEVTSGTVDDCIITIDDETRTIAAGEGPPEDAQAGP